MNEYIESLNNPIYISLIITVLVFVVNYIDNKMQKQEQSYIDQFRKSLYSGIISGTVFYFLQSSSVDVTEKMLSGPM